MDLVTLQQFLERIKGESLLVPNCPADHTDCGCEGELKTDLDNAIEFVTELYGIVVEVLAATDQLVETVGN